jgi:hypothetical protein
MTTYTCIACHEPIQPGNAIIVGVDVEGYPQTLPTNVVAHRGCEDHARSIVARELEQNAKKAQTR